MGGTIEFTGKVEGTAVWSVNGLPAGDATIGTIGPDGRYTAPEVVPLGNPVTISVAGTAAPLDEASVELAITPATPIGEWSAWRGYIDNYGGGVRQRRLNAFVSVRDATVPDAPSTSLASDATATARVLNLRVVHVAEGGVPHEVATRRLYGLFPDDYDFVAVVQPVTFYQNRHYRGVRNTVTGIGVPTYDHGAELGSPKSLEGVIHYPIDSFFDHAIRTSSHEIGHRWMPYHWPISTLASGVMGFDLPGGVGGQFPHTFVTNGDGTDSMVAAPDTGAFHDLELYLMGLLPPDSVGHDFIFQDQAQFPLAPGAVAVGPVSTISAADYIATYGPRDPPYGSAPTTFRLATVVLSAGRLLSDDELAFFEHMAARGEATQRIRFTSGFSAGHARPFFVATGGRAALITTLH